MSHSRNCGGFFTVWKLRSRFAPPSWTVLTSPQNCCSLLWSATRLVPSTASLSSLPRESCSPSFLQGATATVLVQRRGSSRLKVTRRPRCASHGPWDSLCPAFCCCLCGSGFPLVDLFSGALVGKRASPRVCLESCVPVVGILCAVLQGRTLVQVQLSPMHRKLDAGSQVRPLAATRDLWVFPPAAQPCCTTPPTTGRHT